MVSSKKKKTHPLPPFFALEPNRDFGELLHPYIWYYCYSLKQPLKYLFLEKKIRMWIKLLGWGIKGIQEIRLFKHITSNTE